MWFAVAGALCSFVAGLVGWDDVVQLTLDTGPVLAFLAGMLVIAYVTDQAGVFAWLAYHTARASRGNGRLLFVGLYGIGVLVTIWLSLDTTAVILSPIVYNLVRSLRIPPLPFVLASTYVANTASLLLPVSNLTNLIVWNRFPIPFWTYAAVMALPALAAIVINLILFLYIFRRDIPARFDLQLLVPAAPGTIDRDSTEGTSRPPATATDRPSADVFSFCLWGLGAVLAGLGAAPFLGWELWPVALVSAAVLAGYCAARGSLHLRQLVSGVSWDVLPFVFSLFLILRGVGNSGLKAFAQEALVRVGTGETFARLLMVATTTALGSNLINNLPMVLVAADSLAEPVSTGQLSLGTLYAALLGTNLGPNLTVIGSLATMLALSIIANKGLRVSGWLYLKIGALTVPLLLVGSVFGLWVRLNL